MTSANNCGMKLFIALILLVCITSAEPDFEIQSSADGRTTFTIVGEFFVDSHLGYLGKQYRNKQLQSTEKIDILINKDESL